MSQFNLYCFIVVMVFLWTSGSRAALLRKSSCDQICETGSFEIPVCGTDRILYSTMCEFERAKCNAEQKGTSLNIHSTGGCVNLNTTCIEMSDPSVQCVHPDINLICASNNITYDNPCVFMRAKCRNNEIDFKYTGPCNFDTTNASKIDCGAYMTNTTNIAIEDGSIIEPKIVCESHPTDYICLLGGVTYHGACRYCLLQQKRGQINNGNMQVYINHTGRCTHIIIG